MPASTQEVKERIAALGPWFYEFDLGVHGRTASVLSPDVLPIHQTRLEMVSQAVDRYFGDRLAKIRCVDVGCHEGFYSVAMARKGVQQVRGIDLRETNLVKARFVAEVLGIRNVVYEQGNCEDLPGGDIGWNFTKFLIDRHGHPIQRYASPVKPESLDGDIEKALASK